MDFKALFDDDRAVSPVIGVILMVAITVILAAVIGTFVLGLGDQVQDTTPRAQLGFSQSNATFDDGTGSQEVRTVTVTHESGDTLSESNIDVTVNGDTARDLVDFGATNTTQGIWNESGEISAGSSVRVVLADTAGGSIGTAVTFTSGGASDTTGYAALFPGDTVRVVYDSPDSDSTSTLAKREVQ